MVGTCLLVDSNGQIRAIRVNVKPQMSNQDKLYVEMEHGDHSDEDKKGKPAQAAAAKKEEEKKGDAKAAPAAGNATGNATGNASGNSTWKPLWYDYQPTPVLENWYEVGDPHRVHDLKDDTPWNIKTHPEYKKRVQRFLYGSFKDKDLETMKKGTAKDTINHEEIGEEKEREGMYPNELDNEMHGYHYGDRLTPTWRWNNDDVNATKNFNMDYYNHQSTLAPPFDPYGHFESPYYHYDYYSWYGGYSGNAGWRRGYDPDYWTKQGLTDRWGAPTPLLHQQNSTSLPPANHVQAAPPANATSALHQAPAVNAT